jgi:hypothetical protein
MNAGQSPEPCRIQEENRMTGDVGELVVKRAKEVEAPT